jgi:hypothetical protein
MAESYLVTYLNDHLAGSEVALELLEHFERAHAGQPVASVAAGLREDIAADRRELEALMGRLGVAISRPRLVGAWLSEKLTRLKLRLDDRSTGALHQLEVFEAVSVGIEGKRLLWRSLAAAAEGSPELAAADYGHLERRAEDQRNTVEPLRLEAARAALGGKPSAGGG